jgi:phage terminase small subunit
MNFKEKIASLNPLQDFSVEIKLNSWESLVIENIEWKKASLQLLQNHLKWKDSTNDKFNLESFCEYYEEYKQNPEGHHTTIAFLDRYNLESGEILRKYL